MIKTPPPPKKGSRIVVFDRVPRKPWVRPAHSKRLYQKLYKSYDRQYLLTLRYRYMKRGSSSHWDTSLGFHSTIKVENHWSQHIPGSNDSPYELKIQIIFRLSFTNWYMRHFSVSFLPNWETRGCKIWCIQHVMSDDLLRWCSNLMKWTQLSTTANSKIPYVT